MSWYEGDGFQVSLLVGLFVVFLTAVAWPAAGLFRRLTKREANFSRDEKRARRLAGAVSGLGLALGLGAVTLRAWRSGIGGAFGRVHVTLITLAAFAFVWFVQYWNLLGWRF